MKRKFIYTIILILVINFSLNYLLTSIVDADKFKLLYGLKIIQKLFLIVLSLVLIFKSKFKINTRKSILFIIPIWVVLLYLSINNVNNEAFQRNISIDNVNHLLFIVYCFSVAIFEELFFRVYIFKNVMKTVKNSNKKRKLIKVVLYTSAIFALAHITNIFKEDVVSFSVIIQVIFAFGLGVLFQSLLIRYKNILLVIVLHAIVNYLGTYKLWLLKLNINGSSVDFTMSDFLTNIIGSSLFVVVLIFPISYLLLKPSLKKE